MQKKIILIMAVLPLVAQVVACGGEYPDSPNLDEDLEGSRTDNRLDSDSSSPGDQPSDSSSDENSSSDSEPDSDFEIVDAGPNEDAGPDGDSGGFDTDSGADTGSGTDGEANSDSDTDSGADTEELACNGYSELCDRRFDEVLFPMTHNSFSASEYGFLVVANHETGLAAQLDGGVRGFMLDIYQNDGKLEFCHGPCLLGSFEHKKALEIFAGFLAEKPNEIITFIYQDSDNVDKVLLEQDLAEAGLKELLYVHQVGDKWPTLREMIENNTRLLITTERSGGPQPWLHYAYELMWDTKYTHKSTDEFDCEVLRGKKSNDLFLINHWVNNVLDLPYKKAAAKSNSKEMLLARLQRCRQETGQTPNFIAVDFWEQGDLIQATVEMNGL